MLSCRDGEGENAVMGSGHVVRCEKTHLTKIYLLLPAVFEAGLLSQNSIVTQNSVVTQSSVVTQNSVITQNSVVAQSGIITQSSVVAQSGIVRKR